MNLFAALKDECVDTVFADPPFNLGKDYGAGAGSHELKTEDYLRWCRSWMDEAVRVVRPGGAIFYLQSSAMGLPSGGSLGIHRDEFPASAR
ncbi:MAG TPA: DNA methyltransferase [Bryobacteraceae bacterium]|nr:DNA methyltransferase [Bryobacteraceae bacterium]